MWKQCRKRLELQLFTRLLKNNTENIERKYEIAMIPYCKEGMKNGDIILL